jgi:hypothetical protein
LSKDPDSNLGCKIAVDRVSRAGQVKGYDPDEKAYLGPPGWGLGVGPKHHPVKSLCRENLEDVWEGADKWENSTRLEETSWVWGRMEAPFEDGQGPGRFCSTVHGVVI